MTQAVCTDWRSSPEEEEGFRPELQHKCSGLTHRQRATVCRGHVKDQYNKNNVSFCVVLRYIPVQQLHRWSQFICKQALLALKLCKRIVTFYPFLLLSLAQASHHIYRFTL